MKFFVYINLFLLPHPIPDDRCHRRRHCRITPSFDPDCQERQQGQQIEDRDRAEPRAAAAVQAFLSP